MMRGSRRISWASASLSAWRIDFCGMARPPSDKRNTHHEGHEGFTKATKVFGFSLVSFARALRVLCGEGFFFLVRHIHIGEERALGRRRGGAGGFDGAVDQGRDLALDLVELGAVEQGRLGDPRAENPQAIALLAQALDLVLAAVELRVARMVTVEAAGIDFDRRGAAARAGAFDGL